MTPAARHQAAIEILDRILSGSPAEQALTTWARASRFAGSKDRAAIRDLVFDALRCKRSFAHLGGAESGRGLILGGVRAAGHAPDEIFTGIGHAPAPLSATEAAHLPPPMPATVALDCPDWLEPELRASLGADFAPVMGALRQRAPVFLRVNTSRITTDAAQASLAAEGIITRPHLLATSALEVTENARAVLSSAAYLDGLVDLQDVASQAVILALPPLRGARVLDYCAGGGGKSLALAALGAVVTAHDAAPARMRDLPARAARAQARIALTEAARGRFDLVLTDVPCSGSGSWRRSPDAKWRLTPARLQELTQCQADILQKARPHVTPGGALAYVTCSLLACENGTQIAGFLRSAPDFTLETEKRLTPQDGGDGFYLAVLRNISAQG
jgi:16S rRNA (cytosine967-C5)-methyltransferase